MSERVKPETWEIVTPGTVYVHTWSAQKKTYVPTRVGGRGGTRRLQITTEDREYNEDLIIEENVHRNPFRNGTLRRVDAGAPKSERKEWTNDDFREMLGIREPELFREALAEVENDELLVRRLKVLADKEGTVPQLEQIRDIIERRYKVGGTQKTVAEMMAAGERLAGSGLS
jgi:hypothetical protein